MRQGDRGFPEHAPCYSAHACLRVVILGGFSRNGVCATVEAFEAGRKREVPSIGGVVLAPGRSLLDPMPGIDDAGAPTLEVIPTFSAFSLTRSFSGSIVISKPTDLVVKEGRTLTAPEKQCAFLGIYSGELGRQRAVEVEDPTIIQRIGVNVSVAWYANLGLNWLAWSIVVAMILPIDLSSFPIPPVAGQGTLVVLVPTSEGLLVAADSRTTVRNQICDNVVKLIELDKRDRTVLSVTGNGRFHPAPPSSATDLCQYILTAPRLLDIGKIVKEYLDESKQPLSRDVVDGIAEECRREVLRFRSQGIEALISFSGRELFSVVIGHYLPAAGRSIVAGFTIKLAPITLEPEIVKVYWRDLFPNDPRDVVVAGETDYVKTEVSTVGRPFLSEYLRFVSMDFPISQTSLADARLAAINLIEATARTTAIVPAPSGIGGPIDLVLLGKALKPQRLQWKPRPP